MDEHTVYVASSAPAYTEGGLAAYEWRTTRQSAQEIYDRWCQAERGTDGRSNVRLVKLTVAVDPAVLPREVTAELDVRSDEYEMTAPALAQQIRSDSHYRPTGA